MAPAEHFRPPGHPVVGILLAALAACGSPTRAANPAADTDSDAGHGRHQPIPTTEADWKPVTDILGWTGKFGDNNTVYRIALPAPICTSPPTA